MTELESLIQKRAEVGAHTVVIMFQIIALLLIPIAASIYGANLLDGLFSTGKLVAVPLVITSLSISWISIWKIYNKVDKQMLELDSKIKQIKISQGYDPEVNTKRQELFDKEEI